jgi:hypothetical protein
MGDHSMGKSSNTAARLLPARPGFSTVAILSLDLGIGACSAIFRVVDAGLLRKASEN